MSLRNAAARFGRGQSGRFHRNGSQGGEDFHLERPQKRNALQFTRGTAQAGVDL
jgi:hypothetical protein